MTKLHDLVLASLSHHKLVYHNTWSDFEKYIDTFRSRKVCLLIVSVFRLIIAIYKKTEFCEIIVSISKGFLYLPMPNSFPTIWNLAK